MFWSKDNDLGRLMRLFTMYMKFLNSLSELGVAMNNQKTWLDEKINKAKLWYYVEWKYPRLIKYSTDTLMKYSKELDKNPSAIFSILLSYIEFLLTYSATAQKDMNKIINSVLENDNSLTIQSNLDLVEDDNEAIIEWFNIICRTPESFSNFENKYTITKINVNLLDGVCKITQTIYDCEDEFHFKTADVLKFKYMKVDDEGNITNPNYLLDSTIKDDDRNTFWEGSFHVLKTLTNLVLALIDIKIGVEMFFQTNKT